MHITLAQWVLAALASAFIGMSKTGIAGMGTLAVAMYAVIFPSRVSVGIVLPLLILGDLFAVAAYRAHAQWKHLWHLFPWTALGIALGFVVMHRIDNRQTQILIGSLLVLMVAMHLWRKRRGDAIPTKSMAYAAFVGTLAGFSTMTANAAGPLMVLYLLLMGLPKLEFMGTSAWFFCIVNLTKVPLNAQLGLFTATGLRVDAWMAAFVVIGALAGKWVLHRMDQVWFERITLALTVVAAAKMLWPA